MGNGFCAPPLGDQEFSEMLTQGVVLGSLFDDDTRESMRGFVMPISLPAGRLMGPHSGSSIRGFAR